MVRTLALYIIVMIVVALFPLGGVEAAYLYFDPETVSAQKDGTFTVSLKINTEGQLVQGTDAWIAYESDQITVVEAKDPPAQEKFFKENDLLARNTPKLLFLANWIAFGSQPIQGQGTVAVISIKGIKEGTFQLDIRCAQEGRRNSNIAARVNGHTENILDCSKTKDATLTITGSGGTTPTVGPTTSITPGTTLTRTPTPSIRPTTQPGTTVTVAPTSFRTPTPSLTLVPTFTQTPTPSPSSTPVGPTATASATASPSALPDTGNLGTTEMFIGIGLLFTFIGIMAKIFIL